MTINDDHKAHMISVFQNTANRFLEHYNQNKDKLSTRGTKLDYRLGGLDELKDYFNDNVRYIDNIPPGSLLKGLHKIVREGVPLINPIIETYDGHYRKMDKSATTNYNLVLVTYVAIDIRLMFEIYPLFDNYNDRLDMLNSINAAQHYPNFAYSTHNDSHIIQTIMGAQKYADAEIKKMYATYSSPYSVKR